MDNLSRSRRSAMMSRIRATSTRPEKLIAGLLRAKRVAFRSDCADVFGRPDFYFEKKRRAVFVHGCFWHRHVSCRFAAKPKTRVSFWKRKFSTNVRRDAAVRRKLNRLGISVRTIWECQIPGSKKSGKTLSLEKILKRFLQ